MRAVSDKVSAIDDSGVRSGPATVSLDQRAAVEFDAADLVSGNADKGLTGGLGSLSGDVLLEIDTELRVDCSPTCRARSFCPG